MLALLTAVLLSQTTNVPGVQLQDEGSSQGQVTKLNCVGAGVSCAKSGATGTMTISGGAPGSSNFAEVSISLGETGDQFYSTTVTGQAWVTTTSIIVCSPFATSDDGQTVETYAAAMFTVQAATRVNGVGFDLWVSSPNGATGTFRFHCTGG